VRDGVDLLVNTTIRIDLVLQPGQITETVTVKTDVQLLQTDRSDTGRKIEAVQLVNVPLGYNRNFQGLLNLVPGTSRAFQPHSEFFNSQSSLATQVNGVSRMGNNVQFEGVDNNHRTGLNKPMARTGVARWVLGDWQLSQLRLEHQHHHCCRIRRQPYEHGAQNLLQELCAERGPVVSSE
jgi:hypothetical protein